MDIDAGMYDSSKLQSMTCFPGLYELHIAHALGTHNNGKRIHYCALALGRSLGVSLKTQKLYLLVFLARYSDLFFHFISWYHR